MSAVRRMLRSLFDADASRRRGRVGALSARWSPRTLLGATEATSERTRLSLRRYFVLTAGGLVLTAAQVLLMPRWLSARQFGLIVLSISATQAVLQVGDLGLVRLSIDASRSPEERKELRRQGRSMTLLTTTVLIICAAALWPALPSPQQHVIVVLVLGGVAAMAVVTDKFRAASQEVAGDEIAAGGLNLVWTNAPKIGILAGVMLFRSAVWIAFVGMLLAGILSQPSWPGYRDAWKALRKISLWGLPLASIVSSFIMTWADTYFLSAHIGVARAGAYEALYRVMGACTYGFLPWVSVLTSRVSAAERRPIVRPLMLSLAATALGLAGALVFVLVLGHSFFPHLRLPLEALPELVALYMLLPVSFCLGSALYVRAQAKAVTYANAGGALSRGCRSPHVYAQRRANGRCRCLGNGVGNCSGRPGHCVPAVRPRLGSATKRPSNVEVVAGDAVLGLVPVEPHRLPLGFLGGSEHPLELLGGHDRDHTETARRVRPNEMGRTWSSLRSSQRSGLFNRNTGICLAFAKASTSRRKPASDLLDHRRRRDRLTQVPAELAHLAAHLQPRDIHLSKQIVAAATVQLRLSGISLVASSHLDAGSTGGGIAMNPLHSC